MSPTARERQTDLPAPDSGQVPEEPGAPRPALSAIPSPPPRPLSELLRHVNGALRDAAAGDATISGIVDRSEDVEPGSIFVAIPGTAADGHAFIADAARRGAGAIVVERDVGGALDVPLVRVRDARRALAELAAAWYGHPAERLRFVGITGTAGKTSTLSLLETLLVAGDRPVATIGSLGLAVQGETWQESVYTTPDPLLLHRELARVAETGSDLVAMEVTSHALMQERVHGILYDLGIFTNLLPLEHSGYHPTFESYVEAKSRFFDLLRPGAPILYNADDPVTRGLIADRDLEAVPCGSDDDAAVRIETAAISAAGTHLRLAITRPIPRPGGGSLDPVDLDLRLRLLGRAAVANAVLATTAALCLDVDADVARDTLADFPPPRRRLEVVHRGRFTVLDDTVGHPESISIVFDVARRLEPRRLHVVYAVRGRRGERINHENAEALAIWAARLGLATLVITRSAEAADELNRVEEQEYDAFTGPLRHHGVPFEEHDRLEEAVHRVLERADEGDLVLLLGAQGMNDGQEITRAWLRGEEEHGA